LKIAAAKKLQRDMWKNFLLDLKFVSDPAFTDKGGYWHADTSDKPMKGHPLESVLLGEESSGDWRADIAKTLGVSPEWVDGFVRGWANRPDDDLQSGIIDGTQCRLFLERLPFIWEHMEAEEM